MAKINIENINYIVVGHDQNILNLDVSSENWPAYKNMTFFTDTENNIDLSATFRYTNQKMAYPNSNQYGCLLLDSSSPNGTYGKYTLRALYDAKDVAFKSAVAKNISRNVPDEENSIDNDIDIYFPHLTKDPLGFVQIQQYSYGMTEETKIAPVMLGTDLKDQRGSAVKNRTAYTTKPTWQYNLNPYDRFGSNEEDPGTVVNTIPTYLYTSLDSLQRIVYQTIDSKYAALLSNENLSDEALSSKQVEEATYTPISYYSFREFAETHLSDSNVLTSYFKPVYNFQNIEHNYVFEVPVADATGNFHNSYSKAQIKADIVMAKNLYDDIYDTNVAKMGEFDRVRQYVGISNCGGKVFLKYFDDRRYETVNDFKDDRDYRNADGSIADIPMENVNGENEERKDYMKIECIKSINRFISSAMHKTNLFSTKVYGLDGLLNDSGYTEDTKTKIRKDIDNSIRRIVKNFAPAHTQYFGVVDWPAGTTYEEANAKLKC